MKLTYRGIRNESQVIFARAIVEADDRYGKYSDANLAVRSVDVTLCDDVSRWRHAGVIKQAERLRAGVDGEETATDAATEVGYTAAPSDMLTVGTQTALGCTQNTSRQTQQRPAIRTRSCWRPFIRPTSQDVWFTARNCCSRSWWSSEVFIVDQHSSL